MAEQLVQAARDGAGDTTRDIKPRVGHIPRVAPLKPPSYWQNFFKVEVLVPRTKTGKPEQVVRPFHQARLQDAPLNIDSYVAIPGLPFALRVSMTRAGEEGALYGARVYIDSGETKDNKVFRSWNDDEDVVLVDESVDTSRADHYFWFSEGQKERRGTTHRPLNLEF